MMEDTRAFIYISFSKKFYKFKIQRTVRYMFRPIATKLSKFKLQAGVRSQTFATNDHIINVSQKERIITQEVLSLNRGTKTVYTEYTKYSRTPRILINWDGEPSGYAENPDDWIFL